MQQDKFRKYCKCRSGRSFQKRGSLLTWLEFRCGKTGNLCDPVCFMQKVKESKDEKNNTYRIDIWS